MKGRIICRPQINMAHLIPLREDPFCSLKNILEEADARQKQEKQYKLSNKSSLNLFLTPQR